jgi:type IV secretory pathway VirB6-like protein
MGGGSTVMQFLYQGYHTNLAQVVTGYATNLLAAIALTMNGAVMLYIIIFGHRMMFGNLTGGEAVTKASRLIVVAALMGAANYQTFIATPVTQTIPDFISNTITGANGVTGAQGFDALINQVQNFSAHARSQMIGFAYIGDRVATWALEGLAGLFLLICFVVWSLANATADILVPLGAILLPFYLFDATRSYAERWYGKIMSLFLVMIVMLMVGQIVVFQDAQYMQRFEMAIAAAPPDNGFNMNP